MATATKKVPAAKKATALEGAVKTLVIAEKPSVMNDIAKALGGCTKYDDYQENEQYVITSAIGHVLELIAPEQYDVKRGKWSFANLPVVPPHFDLQPMPKTESRLKAVLRLIKRKDIGNIVNACDAGREGELIFRYIVQYAKTDKSISRLWLQSMTPQAIRDGFSNLRNETVMAPLADAARCRAEADWLVGINGTRAMTAFNSKDGGFFLTTVGRVQTPTLAIVVEREEKIRKFVSRDYWEVHAEFVVAQGSYTGRWIDGQFKKNELDPEQKENRLWSELAAQSIVSACRTKDGTVTEESKPTTSAAPGLYDLTSLQREGNSRFGFSAQTTLAIAQALYEKHKALTYPRTDSRHLPEDYVPTVKQTFESLGDMDRYYPHTALALNKGWVKMDKRIFNNAKVSDHFAIIPTGTVPKTLSEAEAKIYDMVVKRFIAVFYPAAEFRVTTRITAVSGHQFKTEGKVLVNPGWMAVYGKEEQKADDALVAISAGETAHTETVKAVGLATKPPARFTESTLLSAMEGAGKLIDDDDMKAAMAGRGLGTPATRAATIEGLINEKYMLREARELMPTAKAFQLMTLLRGLGVEELTQPELTGGWEHKLSQMERGEMSRQTFMQDIARMTQIIVKRAKEYDRDTVPGDYVTLKTPCPHCGGVVQENYRRYACQSCALSLPKHPGGRTFEYDEVETLLKDGIIGPLQGFRSKMGRPFAAVLKIVPDTEHNTKKLEFDFGQEQDDAPPPDFSEQTPLGKCPKCTGHIYEANMSYACEHVHAKTCDFKSGKVILQQDISRTQMEKLLSTGRTDLLDGFVSMRTRRKFKAFLTLGKDSKVGFEFEPRAEKPAAAKKSTAKVTTAGADAAAPAPAAKKVAAKKAPAKKVAAKKVAAKKVVAKKALAS